MRIDRNDYDPQLYGRRGLTIRIPLPYQRGPSGTSPTWSSLLFILSHSSLKPDLEKMVSWSIKLFGCVADRK